MEKGEGSVVALLMGLVGPDCIAKVVRFFFPEYLDIKWLLRAPWGSFVPLPGVVPP